MILLIEDEPGIVDFVTRGLEAEGFAVTASLDGREGEQRALQESFELIVLDLMLPGRGGLEILRSLREAAVNVPVIVLTARGEVEDRVAGLDAGAVDYLLKPFSLAELAARIRAQLRAASQSQEVTLHAGEIDVDLIGREVTHAGTQVRLSSTEFDLLVYLMRHRDRVLSREQILGAVWGYEHDPQTNIVDVYVGYLRRKLKVAGRTAPIVTVRSLGYRFDSAH